MDQAKPRAEKATVDAIIRESMAVIGDTDPARLPHLLRERLAGRVATDVNIDRYISDFLKEVRRGEAGGTASR